MTGDERVGFIINYRLGKKTQKPKECLIKIPGMGASEAGQFLGIKVCWPADEPKIYGKIVSLHGRQGMLKARFKKGIPGQALNSRIKIIK